MLGLRVDVRHGGPRFTLQLLHFVLVQRSATLKLSRLRLQRGASAGARADAAAPVIARRALSTAAPPVRQCSTPVRRRLIRPSRLLRWLLRCSRITA